MPEVSTRQLARRRRTGPSVGLVMVVRDDAERLARVARTVRDQVDHWLLLDTGSSDGTPDLARRLFDGTPGEVIGGAEESAGNAALDAARDRTDWLLVLDPGDTFHGRLDRPALAGSEVDGLDAELRVGDLRWWEPRLLRASSTWRWQGRAEDRLEVPGGARVGRVASFHLEREPDVEAVPDELDGLERDWEDGVDPPRTAFGLARGLEDAGRLSEAASWYRRRLDLDGWEEETWYARWRLGRCLLGTGRVEEGCGLLWATWDDRSWRAEPLWTLAEHYRLAGRWAAAWQACSGAIRTCGVEPFRSAEDPPVGNGDQLYVHADVYAWRLAYEVSISAWWVGEGPLGRRACDHLLEGRALPADLRASVEANRRFYD